MYYTLESDFVTALPEMLFVDNKSLVSVKPLGHSSPKGAQMRRESTYPQGEEFSKTQLDAIKLIASGCTARYTALVLKIKFSEINKWMTQDEQFKNAVAEQVKNLRGDENPEEAKVKPKRKNERTSADTKRSPS